MAVTERTISRGKLAAEAFPVIAGAAMVGAVTGGWWVAAGTVLLAAGSLWRGPSIQVPHVLGMAVTGGAVTLGAIFAPLEWIQTDTASVSELSATTGRGFAFGPSAKLRR